jgi:hypothetical protein
MGKFLAEHQRSAAALALYHVCSRHGRFVPIFVDNTFLLLVNISRNNTCKQKKHLRKDRCPLPHPPRALRLSSRSRIFVSLAQLMHRGLAMEEVVVILVLRPPNYHPSRNKNCNPSPKPTRRVCRSATQVARRGSGRMGRLMSRSSIISFIDCWCNMPKPEHK